MNSTSSDWRYRFLDRLRLENIFLEESLALKTSQLVTAVLMTEGWSKAGSIAFDFDCRFVAIWVKQIDLSMMVFGCLELNGEYLLLKTAVTIEAPEISSWVPFYPAANRPERYLHDMFGLRFVNHPDARRWIRHRAWSESQFPLRKDFSVDSLAISPTLPDNDYPFLAVEGGGVCEVPVGPVHAGIIEPGHFRFQVAGEDILLLEERLGYVHKGIEKIAEGRDVVSLIRLAGRVSGDCTVSYAWATSLACENAANLRISDRALFIRAILAERERIGNHLWDIAAICNDVGFAFPYYQLGRLRELWLRLNQEVFGHRLLMDCVVFGGVNKDLIDRDALKIREQVMLIKHELAEILSILESSSSLQDRIKTTGILPGSDAKKIGALGYVGRASGFNFDLRRDAAYFPYDRFAVDVPVFNTGDVAARLQVRAEEVKISLDLIVNFIDQLPKPKTQSVDATAMCDVEGVGLIESWRGELLSYVSFDHHGKVDRFYVRDPSWCNWPALEIMIHGNIIPDFPVCNKSVNGSYSGHDL